MSISFINGILDYSIKGSVAWDLILSNYQNGDF